MKKLFSNIYHKFFKYRYDENYQNINYKLICEFEKFESEKYRLKLFDNIDIKKIKSVLDYGCGYGMNMKVLKDLNNNINLTGIERSKNKIRMLNIINDNIYKMPLNLYDITKLSKIEKKYDLVFTDAVLIYVNPNNIYELLKKLIHSSKKNVLLHELNHNDNQHDIDHLYVHDYKYLIKKINPRLKIKIFKSKKPGSPWSSHGSIILIDKENANWSLK